jgi:HD domain
MSNGKLRRQITYEAARMLYVRQESQYYKAKLRAARRICKGWIRPDDLPTNREIRDEIQSLARLREGATHAASEHGDALIDPNGPIDRFTVYRMLLLPLETVTQDPARHPEGDALYHSLQVFALARDALPYDEEFQLAALLHDVGKAIDPREHVAAALEALDGTITPRTAWFIENHPQAQALHDGTLGARARRRLEESADFDDLVLLSDCDRAGRKQGVQVPDVDDALAHLRELSADDAA